MGEKKSTCSGYALVFNLPDAHGNIYTADSVSRETFNKMIRDGKIESYEFDHIGVKVEMEYKYTLDDRCEICGNVMDEMGENGICFDCIMAASTPGNY